MARRKVVQAHQSPTKLERMREELTMLTIAYNNAKSHAEELVAKYRLRPDFVGEGNGYVEATMMEMAAQIQVGEQYGG